MRFVCFAARAVEKISRCNIGRVPPEHNHFLAAASVGVLTLLRRLFDGGRLVREPCTRESKDDTKQYPLREFSDWHCLTLVMNGCATAYAPEQD
jgi:hypothetical protein